MPTHAEKRILPYTPEQLFELVAEVEAYPEFLPWCLSLRVKKREENVITADMVIGYKIIRERFTSRVTLQRPGRIDVAYTQGPFKYLNNHWLFEPDGNGGCILDFYVDFEFRSRLFRRAFGVFFNEAVKIMVTAYEKRAKHLYG